MNESSNDRDEASLLDEFFSEIENLTIQDDGDDHDGDINGRKPSCTEAEIGDQKRLKQKEQQQSMIHRAETTKGNWKKFVIDEAASSPASRTQSSSITTPGRKPVSFSIGVGSSVKKKKNPKNKSTITRRKSRENRPEALSAAFGDETSSQSQPLVQQNERLPHTQNPNHILLPQWIAVLDTCAVLESYESVYDMIQLAREATKKPTLPSLVVLEALSIVVPYTVWDELDYRTKEVDDEHQRYKARRAARMLTEELRIQQQDSNQQRAHNNNLYIRSQSRIESHRAVEEFVALSRTTKEEISNDDKILACALWQQDRCAKSTARDMLPANAGGVVLITWDKVLTGKARADRLSVYNPIAFVEYYKKRMASLRSRASVPSQQEATITP